jgi:diguanylate cyclase (GGDEF)-like protein
MTGSKKIELKMICNGTDYQTWIESINDVFVVVNREWHCVYWNTAAEKFSGIRATDALGKRVFELLPTLPRTRCVAAREHATPQSFIAPMPAADGARLYEFSIYPFANGATMCGKDDTERVRMEMELEYLSAHDILTGLHNRAFFEEEMNRLEHTRHKPVSVIMIDVDGLKAVNDSLGHSDGDELLRRAANVLRAVVRAEDVVARIGGDEFAILLPNTPARAASEFHARIEHALATDNAGRAALELSFSIGRATAENETRLSDALKQADRLMYLDKLQHNNRLNHRSASFNAHPDSGAIEHTRAH